jgi:ankyrin repeat protein
VSMSMPGHHLAAAEGHDEATRVLLSHPRIKMGALSVSMKTAMHFAAINGRSEGVQMLLEDGRTNPNAADK